MRKISANLSGNLFDLSRACAHGLRLYAPVAAGVLGALGLAGCNTTVHRSAEPAFFHAGRSVDPRPDATFFPADPRVLAVEDPTISDRLHERLAYRDEPTLYELDSWPQPARPSLSDRRYLYVPDRPNTYLYFQQPRQTHRGHTYFQPVPVYPVYPAPVFDPRR